MFFPSIAFVEAVGKAVDRAPRTARLMTATEF
jgi:hypothetical protein